MTEIIKVPYDPDSGVGGKKDWIKHSKISFGKVEVRAIEQKILFKNPAKHDTDAAQHSLS